MVQAKSNGSPKPPPKKRRGTCQHKMKGPEFLKLFYLSKGVDLKKIPPGGPHRNAHDTLSTGLLYDNNPEMPATAIVVGEEVSGGESIFNLTDLEHLLLYVEHDSIVWVSLAGHGAYLRVEIADAEGATPEEVHIINVFARCTVYNPPR